MRDKTIPELAQGIRGMLDRNGIGFEEVREFIADPAITKSEHNVDVPGVTRLDQFRDNGIPFILANNDVRPGIDRVTQLIKGSIHNLNAQPAEKKSGLYIDPKCENLLAEFDQYIWKETNSEDDGAERQPRKAFDHALDALRYVVMSRPDWDERPPLDTRGKPMESHWDDMWEDEGDTMLEL